MAHPPQHRRLERTINLFVLKLRPEHRCCRHAWNLQSYPYGSEWRWRLIVGYPVSPIPVKFCPWCGEDLRQPRER